MLPILTITLWISLLDEDETDAFSIVSYIDCCSVCTGRRRGGASVVAPNNSDPSSEVVALINTGSNDFQV